MSRKLEALKTMLQWFDDEHLGLDEVVKESQEYQIIEKALKEHEELEKKLELKSFAIEVLEKKLKEKDQFINDISEVKLKQDEILRIIKETFSLRNALLQVCEGEHKVFPARFKKIKEWLKQ